MKIQCDVCEKAPATVICCADEAALCSRCDVEVHAANKLAGKHQRLLLDCLAARLPRCDICQEKAAFIFCVEDRALFCRDCDEPIHVAGTLSGDHQRYLATGIRVASSRSASKDPRKITNPPEPPSPRPTAAVREEASSFLHSSPWAVPGLLQLSDYDSGDQKESDPVAFGVELDPFADFGLLHAHITGGGDNLRAAARVPELPNSGATFAGYCRSSKGSIALKRARMEVSDEDDEFFTVPDLGKI